MPPVRRPEVLAPAGDVESMRAAVRAGADSVYFGLQGMNARARATNFDVADLGRTIEFLHDHGVRGHVTLNTLVFDDELGAFESAVRACAAAGVDAIILQDLGAVGLARAIAPDLPIHASTQMTCTDATAVNLARRAGASRVILPRELSIDEIAKIRSETDMELEAFVHGALCIAYSGQCLTSEAIGGRSANRGACAQACRLPYDLIVDGELRDLGDRAYLLSPEDLEASILVPRLIDAGISALKIEGRLKGPEYVAATTMLYRRAVSAALGETTAPTDDDRRDALQMFSRGSGPGFLGGIDHQRLVEAKSCDHRGLLAGTLAGVVRSRGKPHLAVRAEAPLVLGDGILVEGGKASEGEVGGRIWGLVVGGASVERVESGTEAWVWLGPDKRIEGAVTGHRVWKTNDPVRERAIQTRMDRSPYRVPIDVHVSGIFGEAPVFEATSERGASARVTGDAVVEHARSNGLTPEVAREKLGRLGESPFALAGLTLDLPEGATVPLASLNRARRSLVDALAQSHRRSWPATQVNHVEYIARSTPPEQPPPPPGLFVLCRNLPQAEAAIDAGASGVYLDFLELTGTGAAMRKLRARSKAPIGVAPPRIRKPGEEKIDAYLRSLAPDAILVRSLGALANDADTDDPRIPRIGDHSLNVTNRLSAMEVLARKLVAFTPSFDLDATQLVALTSSAFAPFAEVVVHHPMPLFHMEHCVIAALLSEGRDHKTCGRPCDTAKVSLRDRAGMVHPVEADVGCRNTVFHAVPQSAAGLIASLAKNGVGRFRIELVREEPADVTRVVTAYRGLLDGSLPANEVWRTLRTDSGYGVVRGSLRVLS